VSKRKVPAKPVLSAKELLVIRICLTAALGVSVYLAWIGFTNFSIPGCGPESDCDRVLGTRWSKVFQIPVSVFAAFVYGLAFYYLRGGGKNWKVLNTLAGVMAGAALWFVGLQVVALHAYCKFCLTAHFAGTVAAAILLWKSPLGTNGIFKWSSLGAGALLLLIFAQVQYPPSENLKSYASGTPAAQVSNSVVQATGNVREAVRLFETLGGEVQIDVSIVPVMGSRDGSKKALLLFDYTCHHCRNLHLLFQPLLRQYPELGVISLAMPLDGQCNPSIKRTPPAHIHACEYAKLGLAIFYADSGKATQYDDWFFASETPPSLESARKYAEQLVTAEALEKSLADPKTARQLNQDIQIYELNTRMSKSQGQMPQMLFPEGTHIGAINSTRELEEVLKNGIGL
jgi:uncharacterized membrane protein